MRDARDVIAQVPSGLRYLDQTMNWKQGVIGSKDADAILSALQRAGFVVVNAEAQQVFLVMTVKGGEYETTHVFSSLERAKAWANKCQCSYVLTSRVVDHPEATTEAMQ